MPELAPVTATTVSAMSLISAVTDPPMQAVTLIGTATEIELVMAVG
jgi:hypothetical protein